MGTLGDKIVNDVKRALEEAENEMIRTNIDDVVINGSLKIPGLTLQIDASKAIKITMDAIEDSVRRWQEIVSREILVYLNEAMSSTAWPSGTDIIDTGELRDSVSISISGSNIEVSYDVAYANLVHYGGYIMPYGNTRANMVYIEGRPWAESVLFGGGPFKQYDYAEAYSRALSSVL